MSYLGYFNATISNNGIPITATITVYLAGTATKATIYSTPSGTLKDNPFQTDVLGRFQFFAAVGQYDVEISGSGITTYKIQYINVSDVTKSTQLTDMPQSLSGQARKQLKVMNDEVGFDLFEPAEVDVRNYTSFSAAIDAIGSAEKTLVIPNEQNVTADKTVPSNIALRLLKGGNLNIATGVTVTINGNVDAGLTKIFSWAGTGKVVFGVGSVKEIYPQWWGANTIPGTTDMTAAVQAAVNACLADPLRPIPLMICGPCKLTGSIIIDRAINLSLTKGAFRIIGVGQAAGFYVTTAIDMFSSSIVDANNPVSEGISFENLQFEASTYALAAYVLDGRKFLRVQFLNCKFSYIKALTSAIYIQSIYFTKCLGIRSWGGIFCHTDGNAMDISFEGNLAEWGESLLFSIGGMWSGCRFMNNLVEGCVGKVLNATGGSAGIQFSGNYFEVNDEEGVGPYINFGDSFGVDFTGNLFVMYPDQEEDADYYAVHWGYALGVKTSGNYCTGKLHNTTDIVPVPPYILNFSSMGDFDAGATGKLTCLGGFAYLSGLTTAQRDALTALNGMVIYNSTTNAFNFYENGAWVTK